MNKELKLIEAQGIVEWFNDFKAERIKSLPIKAQWYLLSNIKEMTPVILKFEEIRNNFIADIQKEYFSDDKSKVIQIQQKENGVPVYDNAGNPVMVNAREIKDEFIEDYHKSVDEINETIRQMFEETTNYNFKEIDIESLIDSLENTANIDLKDMEMINIFSMS